jgi:type II secretory pathway pseudopilin PulG
MLSSVQSRKNGRAFSVVELIVVMGLISVLMAMLLPALAASRETAKMVQCQSNLRQIGQALFEYANVYGGKLPLWSGWNVYPDGSSPEDDPGLAWTEELAFTFNQTPLSQVYDCPAFPVDVPMNYFLEARWSHLHGRHNIKLTEVRLSSDYIRRRNGDAASF